jgi:hypothetical protein
MLIQDVPLIESALQSGCAHAIVMACIILQEWAYSQSGVAEDAANLVPLLTNFIESPAPATYTELAPILERIGTDTQALLQSFTDAKVPKSSIPNLGPKVTIAVAQNGLTTHFDTLIKLVPKAGTKAVAGLQDRKAQIYASIGYLAITKERLDAQVGAAVATALLALQAVPEKHGPLVRAVMNAVKVRLPCSELMTGRRIRNPATTRCPGGIRLYIIRPIAPLEETNQCARQGRPKPIHLYTFRSDRLSHLFAIPGRYLVAVRQENGRRRDGGAKEETGHATWSPPCV